MLFNNNCAWETNEPMRLDYEDKVARLTCRELFDFFLSIGAEPTKDGKNIRLRTLCHGGKSHGAVCDTETLKITCFSGCNDTVMLHTWVKRALKLDNAFEARELIETWIDDRKIDLSNREVREPPEQEKNGTKARQSTEDFKPEHIEPEPGIPPETIDRLYSEFDAKAETLERMRWHTEDGISVEQLQKFQIAYNPANKTIILPHHNINGEIVGLYERHFSMLRKEAEEELPGYDYDFYYQFPTAKYLPLLRPTWDKSKEKKCYSFHNKNNLYGLHLAKDSIRKTGKAIIFEGGKSVMLAHDYGYPFAVASHTFGASLSHISMLIEQGAKEIILAFDKQYETVDDRDEQWRLYDKKTREFARKIGKYVNVSRIVDFAHAPKIGYKDAPIDKGKEIFDELYSRREMLIVNGEEQPPRGDMLIF